MDSEETTSDHYSRTANGFMNDGLDLFADLAPASEPQPQRRSPMTDEQRGDIRSLFGALGKATAREQFAMVEELIGTRITSVGDLTSSDAGKLVERLRRRVASKSRSTTGNSWADREEDTWIDRL